MIRTCLGSSERRRWLIVWASSVCRAQLLAWGMFLCVANVAVWAQSASIHGKLTDNNGAPISSARVTLFAEDMQKKSELGRTLTDSEGIFNFTGLQALKYRIEITHKVLNVDQIVHLSASTEPAIKEVRVQFGSACREESTAVNDLPGNKVIGELVRIALNDAIMRAISKEGKREIVLSKKGPNKEWLADGFPSNIQILSPEQIQSKADRSGDFPYLAVSEVRAIRGCVAVSVDYVWAIGRNSIQIHLDGGGADYEFRKIDGKWVLTYLPTWVS